MQGSFQTYTSTAAGVNVTATKQLCICVVFSKTSHVILMGKGLCVVQTLEFDASYDYAQFSCTKIAHTEILDKMFRNFF